MNDLLRQRALIAYLRAMGDPRLGGSLPIGGKGSAGGYSIDRDGAAMEAGGMSTVGRGRGARQPGPLYSPLGRAGEESVYDHLMNLKEQELEDVMVRRNANISDLWGRR